MSHRKLRIDLNQPNKISPHWGSEISRYRLGLLRATTGSAEGCVQVRPNPALANGEERRPQWKWSHPPIS